MNLFCIGVNHRTANVATRERFAGDDETVSILRAAGCIEVLILATCNRVEVYGTAEKLTGHRRHRRLPDSGSSGG